MKQFFCFAGIFSVVSSVLGQSVVTQPAVPSAGQPVTISFDVGGTDFAAKNLDDVWLWAWLENGANDVNAPTNVNPATAVQDAAKVTRSSTNRNVYTITLTATEFFNKPADEINTVGVLLKGRDWADGQTADKFITFTKSFNVAFASPASPLFFVNEGETLDITVNVNEPATIELRTEDGIMASSSGMVTAFSYAHLVSGAGGSVTVTAEATNNSGTITASFTYVIRTATVSAPRPAGVIDGINYSTDATKAILSLWAPSKSSVYVLGEFNDFKIDPAFQMKRDGEHFWLEITGLIPGTEYAFQYLVDEAVKIADPYADKILDPDDVQIPSVTYPGLKAYPHEALSDEWYFNRLAVLQTNQEPYAWVVNDFEKPSRQNLIIYELLVRDFFGAGERNYQNLIDTLGYLKRLGVNAIELMPIMEFNGNESWGYNPTFMFAPDKYYGTKNKFKELVDKCHQNGIAVILDIAMNHQDIPNPYVMMDFDFANGKPQADNKWFNVDPTHPFNVFFDMNHESAYTQKYLDTVNHYWLNEYRVDGFRFDLSKGFTQTHNPGDVEAWSAYDAGRIALLQRMADIIWKHSPDAYVILEHLAANEEEKVLAEYRGDEGKGMMLWGKMTDAYNQLTMGYPENADISGVHYASRGWNFPHLVGYMESHDEERLMVKNILYGNAVAPYSVKDTLTALARMRAATTLFYTIPGPKMLWQFGELGYDYSINYCPDGSNHPDCRVSPKPAGWPYRHAPHRHRLYDHIRDLLRLRSEFDLFTDGTVTFGGGNSLIPQIMLKNTPYVPSPAVADDMNAVVAANFDVIERTVQVEFPHTGIWYDYYADGRAVNVTGSSEPVVMRPGAYKLFTDIALESTVITRVEKNAEEEVAVFPNPVGGELIIFASSGGITAVSVYTDQGVSIPLKKGSGAGWDVRLLPPGLYVAEIRSRAGIHRVKIFKK